MKKVEMINLSPDTTLHLIFKPCLFVVKTRKKKHPLKFMFMLHSVLIWRSVMNSCLKLLHQISRQWTHVASIKSGNANPASLDSFPWPLSKAKSDSSTDSAFLFLHISHSYSSASQPLTSAWLWSSRFWSAHHPHKAVSNHEMNCTL